MEKAKQADSFNKPLPKKKAAKKRVVKKSDRFTVSHGQLVCVMLNLYFLHLYYNASFLMSQTMRS